MTKESLQIVESRRCVIFLWIMSKMKITVLSILKCDLRFEREQYSKEVSLKRVLKGFCPLSQILSSYHMRVRKQKAMQFAAWPAWKQQKQLDILIVFIQAK